MSGDADDDDVVDLGAVRERRAAEREAAERAARPTVKVYVDSDGDVCVDLDVERDEVVGFPPDVATDLGLLIVATANPDLFDRIVVALRRERANRLRRERSRARRCRP